MIEYKTNFPISVEQFIELLNKTTLGARRPLCDEKRVAAMLHHADLLVTAWDGELLVGVARSVTDFAYCCYLSDLAVDEQYQKRLMYDPFFTLMKCALSVIYLLTTQIVQSLFQAFFNSSSMHSCAV